MRQIATRAKGMVRLLFLSVALVPALARGAAPTQPQAMPTSQDLQQMYEAGQYHLCLQQIARAMSLKGDAARGFDRHELLLLRGECLMRLGDRVTARKAFVSAQESPDPATALTARANVLIIEGSRGFVFAPSGKEPIDIREPVNRRKAMLWLFDAGLRGVHDAVEAAERSSSLVPTFDILPKLKDLAALELTATGNDTEIRPALSRVGEHARGLMIAAMEELGAGVTRVEQTANQAVLVGGVVGSPWAASGRRGLDTADRQALQDILTTAGQIYDAATQGHMTAQALKGKPELWEQVVNQASQLIDHANQVRDAE